ncbi:MULTISPECIES: nitroreductase family protein [Rhizobium/Agrobacterium group]|uniref:nitroreductase family protein n=1 Tax=Rhizobium/Agrobacterium group TaxID=227290 RepID=UPI000B4017AB|nr:nitroreductase family protein [Allorhizobium ampelinum]MCF1480744.1 nitroreductase family protein [Allorhizobium ampelinum]OVE92976.1 nitroreductase [Allorhizobium ampelinum]
MSISSNNRSSDYDIDPIFLDRWSPRALDPQAMSEEDLMTILEAARWAPSSFNAQPWRFIYAQRDTPEWQNIFGLLAPMNQAWASRASVLVVIVSANTAIMPMQTEPVPSYSHSFDAGAAWAYLALQATRLGWYAHGMAGFDVPRSYEVLGVPESFRVEAVIAIGRIGDKSLLPPPLQEREQPNGRRPLQESAMKGRFVS